MIRKLRQACVTASVSTDVDASMDVVWKTMADMESWPNFIKMMPSVHRLNGSRGDWTIGTRWRETRVIRRKVFILIRTITSMTVDEKVRSVRFTTGFAENHRGLKNAVNISSLVVISSGEGKCKIVGSFAWMPENSFDRFILFLFGRSVMKNASKSFESEIQEIAAEAERRTNKIDC